VSAGATGSRRNPIREIFWTRTGLLLTILIVVSAGAMWISSFMTAGIFKNFVVSIGTGTMISAIVGFGQTLITASASHRALVAPVIEESRRALQDLSAEYRALNKEFFPTHVFEATTEPDPSFNRLMMHDLMATRQYFFRGFSGRHAAARLVLSPAEWELRVAVADPREPAAISGRARYLLRREGAAADYEKIQKRLYEEISVGLVGLFIARSRCSRVDVTVVPDPTLDRLELFDESAWITLFSDTGGATTLYPRTLRFSSGSFIYNMERAEFLRICNAQTAQHFIIKPDMTREEFLILFEKITGSSLSEQGMRELERKFHAFREEFSTAAELGS
jgi:hypothetical protein